MIRRLEAHLLKLRNRHFLMLDTIIFAITPLFALCLRLDSSVGFVLSIERFQASLLLITVLFTVLKLAVSLSFGLYRHYWRYAGVDELIKIASLMAATIILQTLLFAGLQSLSIITLPRSLPAIDGLLTLLLVGGSRFGMRVIARSQQRRTALERCDRALIVGAGDAGVALVQELQRNSELNLVPVAFIDDDPQKLNHHIRGLLVVGNRDKIPDIVRSWHIHKIIIAMPSVRGRVIRDIVEICQRAETQTLTLPGMHDILSHHGSLINRIRKVQIEDLLRREPIQTDIQQVQGLLRGKRVLITGAGGSIGSELCRQVLRCSPTEIVLLGHGENSVFQIQQELNHLIQDQPPERQTRLIPFIGDLRHPSRIGCAFEQFRPEIIFHAAAHKHVPLMEGNPPEAITNNVLGTKALLALALQYDVERFVMISTDKAVNPTNVMGASKRVAEMLVLQASQRATNPFVVVRFGNVLGSRGSVIPTFQQQIAAGGPVTVTHPQICRYFMTIPEAVQLTLQAAVISPGSEVLMLDMGEPVKIVELAQDLIHLSGYEVNKEIEICFTGLRPGEKLVEELFIPGEQYEQTQHEKLLVVKNASHIVPNNLNQVVADLQQAATDNDHQRIRSLLAKTVPGYTPKLQETASLQPPFSPSNIQAKWVF